MKQKVIYDTDPGQDDAVALLVALASPDEIDMLGIVSVAGNVPLSLTTTNALKIVELAGRSDVPVHAGCDAPLERTLVTAEHVHGHTGLNGPALPQPTTPVQDQHGVDFILETLEAHEAGTVTLCVLGPMTNIGAAIRKNAEIMKKAAGIVMMGGAYFEVGNITPTAEFNIYVDPAAADIVFRSGIPITMMPLDVTHLALTTAERLSRLRAIGNRAGTAVAEMLHFSERFDLDKYESKGAPLHDPCVTAWLLNPDLFEGRFINVEIETQSALTMGMTVADYWRVTDRQPNATFIRSLDSDGFYDLLIERLARLP